MSKKKAKSIIYLFASIFLIGAIFLFYNKNNIKADSDLGILKSKKEFGLVLDRKQINFSIKAYSQNSTKKNYLFTNSLFKVRRIELLGFEDDIGLCSKKVINLGNKEEICLVGDVGVHSQNIAFLDDQMSLIKIVENSEIFYNIVSDVPNYKIQDYNDDGFEDVVVDNRDYDRNPLSDIIRKYYLGTNHGFVFDKSEAVAVK